MPPAGQSPRSIAHSSHCRLSGNVQTPNWPPLRFFSRVSRPPLSTQFCEAGLARPTTGAVFAGGSARAGGPAEAVLAASATRICAKPMTEGDRVAKVVPLIRGRTLGAAVAAANAQLSTLAAWLDGGGGRNRTGVDGFAGRCMTTLPPRRVDTHRTIRLAPNCARSRSATISAKGKAGALPHKNWSG